MQGCTLRKKNTLTRLPPNGCPGTRGALQIIYPWAAKISNREPELQGA